VHDVRVALDHHVFGEFYAADFRDPPGVVAAEVEQLDVFGALLLVGQQFGRQRLVFLEGRAAFARPGDRAHGDGVAFEAHENLRRGADDVEVLEVEIEHVGRGVDRAQGAVERQGTGLKGLAHALRKDDLHDVAFGDVVLGLEHGLLEMRFAKQRNCGLRRPWRFDRDTRRLAQPGQQFLQPRLRLLVGAGNAGLGVDDQRELAGEVIDDGDFFGKQENDVGRAEFVGLGRTRQLGFDVAHGVVAETADQAATEARQAR